MTLIVESGGGARATVLVVEDDTSIRVGLEMNLRYEGYRVLCAETGEAGLELARREEPDLIVLDLMLPGCSGHDVLRSLRREGRTMQVLILSALGREEDVVAGLKLGADDYVSKPFSAAELLARIEAALRRVQLRQRVASAVVEQDRTLRFGAIEIDVERRQVSREGELVKLTSREFDLLALLADHPERVFSREQLLEHVWGHDYAGTARTVDNFVRSLRSKLEATPRKPRHLQTVHGIGYRFDP